MFDFQFHIKQDLTALEKKLDKISVNQNLINIKITRMAKSVADIEAKVDALQTALDNEQAQIQTSIDGLNTTIQELRDQIANGANDQEAFERIATKLDAIQTDLEGTIADTPETPTEPQP
jgi:chromosome segregation ATPase